MPMKGCRINAFALHLQPLEQGGIFIVPPLMIIAASVFRVSPEGLSQSSPRLQKPGVLRPY